ALHVDQRGHRLFGLQSPESQSDPARIRHVAHANAVPADRASPAQERPAVSAELFARELARLSLLGFGTRAVRSELSCPAKAGISIRTLGFYALRRVLATPHTAIPASASEISTLYPASDRPRKRHGASSQRTTLTFRSCFIRSEARPRLVTGPEQSAGPAQSFHSMPEW